jgi:hypothetical protein
MPATYEIITIFEVCKTVNERGEAGEVLDYVDSRPAAAARAHGAGWWGGDGKINEVVALVIDGKVFALREPNPVTVLSLADVRAGRPIPQSDVDAEVRRGALAKLSAQERKALGYEG